MGLRTIKFRGKSIYGDEWLLGSLIKIEEDRYAVIPNLNDIEIGESIGMYEVYSETVGQFTGLLDKNGKEIYEGDILNNGQRNYFVCWNSERGAWWLKNKDLIYTTPLGFLSIELFVVGNIYDNPDLIKEE
ncbi:YopX family protein [Bacteroides ovatus]|jgi:uncharacterized phage protein (TIGR01671 family)|uniref:YopX family protein n=1 Tax=Bacteroides ovatus TaxID=28116 RepID=UPI002927197B|nr:hypothetical protein AUSP0029_00086 [uncultured phage]